MPSSVQGADLDSVEWAKVSLWVGPAEIIFSSAPLVVKPCSHLSRFAADSQWCLCVASLRENAVASDSLHAAWTPCRRGRSCQQIPTFACAPEAGTIPLNTDGIMQPGTDTSWKELIDRPTCHLRCSQLLPSSLYLYLDHGRDGWEFPLQAGGIQPQVQAAPVQSHLCDLVSPGHAHSRVGTFSPRRRGAAGWIPPWTTGESKREKVSGRE